MKDDLERLKTECLEWLRAREYRPQTLKAYGGALRSYLAWVEAQDELQSLADLDARQLQDYLISLSLRVSKKRKRGTEEKALLSAATRNSHISALVQLFTYLYKQGKILTNPALEMERPRERRGLPRTILTVNEMLRILSIIGVDEPLALRDRAALELLYTTGLRRGELERLNLDSVRFDERLILVDGKGGHQRLVPFGQEAYRCLLEYLKHGRPKLRDDGTKALFLSSRKGRMRASALLRSFKNYAKLAGVEKAVDLHCIRHTCATHMLAGDADIRYIQELLGHVSLNTTQVYTRVEISDLKKMLDRCHPRDKF